MPHTHTHNGNKQPSNYEYKLIIRLPHGGGTGGGRV